MCLFFVQAVPGCFYFCLVSMEMILFLFRQYGDVSTEAIWGDSIFLTGGYFMIYFFVQVLFHINCNRSLSMCFHFHFGPERCYLFS